MKILFTIILSAVTFLSFSQTPSEIKKIKKSNNKKELLSIKKANKSPYTKNELKKIAKNNNWKYTISEDNTFSQLVGITNDNKPIYYQTYNFGAGVTSGAHSLNSGGILNLDINGQNMLSGIWDGGAARTTHELYTGRVQVMDGTTNVSDHATHVIGTVMGDDGVESGNARGMAYMADAHSYDWNSDVQEVTTAAANGLLLSNHSYGYNPIFLSTYQFGKYDNNSQAFDDIMYNAPYYQFVSAAGNSRNSGFNPGGNGYDLLTGSSLAKNGITVAAVNEVLNYQDANSVVMSSFSSWGPTDDGRIKPDISAKGVDLYSSVAASDNSYSVYSGTSMASPSVNGTLLLLQQYYNNLNNDFMKASTLRGLMIHTANEAGNAPGPDYSFGWGLINAEKAAQLITDEGVFSVIDENTLDNTTNQVVNNYSAIGTEPVVVTICWTDPAGNPTDNTIVDDSTPMLVNDLDVEVINNGNTYQPWKLDPSSLSSPATTGDNTVDNVEKIEIPNPTGNIQVVVSHKNSLVNNQQDYSLIVSGVTPNDFWFSLSNNEDLEICNSTSSVNLDFDFFKSPNFNDTVSLSTSNLPSGLTSNFNPSTINNETSFQLQLNGTDNLSAGEYDFTVTGQYNSTTYDLPLTLKVFGQLNNSVSLVSPTNAANDVDVNTNFTWTSDPDASEYNLQVATDNTFSNIIIDELLTTNSYATTSLMYQTQYYWRVLNINACGDGVYSAINTFTTNCNNAIDLLMISNSSSSVDVEIDDTNSSQWEIETVPEGGVPTGSGDIFNNTIVSIDNLSSSTCYDFYVRSICGSGFSQWSGPYTFCTSADYCGGDHFYDSGGANGNYSNNENLTETIYPEDAGDRIRAVFQSFQLESGFDYFSIYDGTSTSDPLLFNGSGSNSPGTVVSSHPSGALTFTFTSDGSVTYPGWDAEIICEEMPACPNPPSNLNVVSATSSELSVGWTENGSSTSWEVEIVPQGTSPSGSGTITTSNPHTFTGLSSSTLYDVYVRAICTDGNSDWVMGTFETACASIVAPIFEPFSSFQTPNCWLESGSESWNYSTYADYGASFAGDYTNGGNTNYAWIDGSTPNGSSQISTLTTQPIDISNLSVPALQFALFSYNSSSNDYNTIEVEVYDGNTWLNLVTNQGPTAGNDWELKTFDLSGLSLPNETSIRFTITENANIPFNNDILVDDFRVFELPDCPNTPSGLNLVSATSTELTVGWTETGSSTSWEVEILPQGTSPSGSGTITTSNPHTFTGLSSSTLYDVYVRAICTDGNSAWVMGTFETQADYCSGDHFYDSGGANGNYSNNENLTETIYPDDAGDRIRAIFQSFQLEGCCDYLSIYNGTSTSDPLLFSGNGSNSPGTVASTHPSGALTFTFTSDGSGTYSGWDAEIICEEMPACPNTPSNLNLVSATSSELSVGWTENGSSTSWEVEIVPQGTSPSGSGTVTTSNPYTFTGLSSSTLYDVYIRSICTDGNSDWVTGTFETQGDYCGGDHFYDSGGANGNYSNNENLTETIYPEDAGDRIRAVFQSFQLESGFDYFSIYDGTSTSDPLLFSGSGSNSPGTVVSTHPSGALTFTFTSDGSVTYSGWDAEIICEEMPACPNPPSNLNLVSATSSELSVGWTENGNSTSWEVEIVPQGTSPSGSGTVTTSNPHTFNGLSSSTLYDVYVRSICTGGNSDWVMGTFETACASIVAPMFEPFSSFQTPNCWLESGSESWNFSTFADYGASFAGDYTDSGNTNYAWIDGSTPNGSSQISTLTTQPIDISNLSEPALQFALFSYNNSSNDYNTIEVEVYDGNTWLNLITNQGPTAGNDWELKTFDLSGLSLPNEISVRFTITENANIPYNNDILVDDFRVFELPACPNTPSDLNLVGATSSELSVGWTETGSSTSWEVEIVPQGTSPSGSGTVTTSNPHTFSGLSSSTLYDVYVRSICTDGNSDWVMGTFETTCASILAPMFEPFSSFQTPNCWLESGSESWNYSTFADYAAAFAGDYTDGGNTNYAWIDGSTPNGSNQISTLTTQPIDISNLSVPALQFALFSYNNSSNDYNTIEVEVFDGNTWLNLITNQGPTAGNDWELKTFDLSGLSLPNEISVRFTITENANAPYNNDILLDDFSVFDLPDCLNTPSNLNLVGATSSELNVGWTETGSSTSWEVEIVPQGTTPSGSGTVTANNPHTFTGLSSSTLYDVYVRAICTDGNSDWVMGTFETQADYCGGDHFYDSGGANGNYSNNENWTETIYPSEAGDKVTAIFNSFNLEGCCDYLSIYDGTSTSDPLLFSGSGSNSPGTVVSTHQTGALYFVFTSDGSVTSSGWDAEIICDTLGVDDINDKDDLLTFYPNPVEDILHIELDNNTISTVKIFDLAGKLLINNVIDSNKARLNFEGYPSGNYLIYITLKNGNYQSFKVLKKE